MAFGKECACEVNSNLLINRQLVQEQCVYELVNGATTCFQKVRHDMLTNGRHLVDWRCVTETRQNVVCIKLNQVVASLRGLRICTAAIRSIGSVIPH